MTGFNIAVIPGDGIGPEVMNEALKVLKVLEEHDPSLKVSTDLFQWNSDYYVKHGAMMPKNGLEILKGYDAILFGAIGDERVPDDVTVWELIMPIRKKFHQYVNLRPVKTLKGINTPLKTNKPIDFVIIRENSEGEYSHAGGRLFETDLTEMAIQNTVMTRAGIERVARFAFEYARKKGLSRITSATKSNAVVHVMKFWDEAVTAIAEQYPNIQLENVYIDALSAYFVQKPEHFELVLTSNLFGDILSDLGSALVGGLGLSPSANLNPEHQFPSMFEPVHGSAPDIAGKGVANPIAQIWSLALMLEHLGREDLSHTVLESIEHVLVNKTALTPDLGGQSSTEEMGNAISDWLKEKMQGDEHDIK